MFRVHKSTYMLLKPQRGDMAAVEPSHAAPAELESSIGGYYIHAAPTELVLDSRMAN